VYYTQMTAGCSNPGCCNLLCRTNQESLVHSPPLQELSKNDVAGLCVKLALCPER
jgi:hypothetical protein